MDSHLPLGVVIPALDEAATLPALLADLARLSLPPGRLLVVDGGSCDETVRAGRAGGALILRSRPGRARQMNAGAAFLTTPWLLFLHADSRLDDAALAAIDRHVEANGSDAAHFSLAFRHLHRFYRVLEWGQRVRERTLGLVYGDQGLLIRRDLFFARGAFPDVPLMEDVILNRRLLRRGQLRPLLATVTTSPRRYEEEGRIRGLLRNVRLISRFLAGADPARLAVAYPPRRRLASPPVQGTRPADEPSLANHASPPDSAGSARLRPRPEFTTAPNLLVFARAPRPGAVKTRLARTLGDERAAALYRRMGRVVIDRVAGSPATVTVCFTPDGAEREVREWLGAGAARYWPQGSGDLGERMSRMFDRAFEGSGRAVVIGTDAPAVDRTTIRRALSALDSADVVVGPSRDGGYYLLGLRQPRPRLFRGIRWSTGSVMRETLDRARADGLAVTLLEVESDIDTAADLTPGIARILGREA